MLSGRQRRRDGIWAGVVALLATAVAAGTVSPAPVEAASYSASLQTAINDLPVRAETPAGYDRDLFDHWIDADGDGRDTRAEALIEESLVPVSFSGNTVVSGEWFSYYDEVTWTAASDVDIDHLVPLKEAWDSGASSWDAATRRDFANDLDDPRTLVAVTDTVNQSKGSRDIAEWLPPGTPGFRGAG